MPPKNVIEKPGTEESTETEEGGTRAAYRKYPDDPSGWTPEHDFKAFGDIAKILAKAPYAAQCRMHAYLERLIRPDHAAEEARQAAQYKQREAMAIGNSAYGGQAPMVTGANNGLVGALKPVY